MTAFEHHDVQVVSHNHDLPPSASQSRPRLQINRVPSTLYNLFHIHTRTAKQTSSGSFAADHFVTRIIRAPPPRPTDNGKAIGGWDPSWDIFKVPAPRPLMPPKLHKNQRDRAKRAEKVSHGTTPSTLHTPASTAFTLSADTWGGHRCCRVDG